MDTFEYDDSASNPQSDEHLPVGGEVSPTDGEVAPDINHDMEAGDNTRGVLGD